MILEVDRCSLPNLNWCIECDYLRTHLSFEIQLVKRASDYTLMAYTINILNFHLLASGILFMQMRKAENL